MKLFRRALAAAALFGLTSTAAVALPFTLAIDLPQTAPEGTASFRLAGDTGARQVALIYRESSARRNEPVIDAVAFEDGSAAFQISQRTATQTAASMTRGATFAIADPDFRYSITNDDPSAPTSLTKGFSLAFRLVETTYADMRPIEYTIENLKLVLAGFSAPVGGISVTETGDVLSPVPLPATLPLLGVGLVAVAGVGVVRRRAAASARA